MPDAVVNITFYPVFEGVCLVQIDDHFPAGYENSPRAERGRACSSTGARVTAADTSISPSRYSGFPDSGTCDKELAGEGVRSCCLERRSFDGAEISSDVPSCRAKQLSAFEHGFRRRRHSNLLSLSANCSFRSVKLSLVGHMESNFNVFNESSMCMSTACDVHSSGGFDASGHNVHTLLAL